MANHGHTAFLAGRDPSECITRSCHTGFARWLNTSQDRRGRVMLCRPTIKYATDQDGIARLLAYVHNNPAKVEPGTVAKDSEWTSHRAYLGLASPPDWVDIELGLELAGFDASRSGRAQFDAFTNSRLLEPADAAIGDCDPRPVRARARAATGAPVELCTPQIAGAEMSYDIVADAATPLRLSEIDPERVISTVASTLGLSAPVLRERGQRRTVVSARRIAVLVWAHRGRAAITMARALGIAQSSASYLRHSSSVEERRLALEIACSFEAC